MVVLWIPNLLTSLANFFFSLNLLITCPWWCETFIIPFLFVWIISSYRLISFAAFFWILYLFRFFVQILGFCLLSLNLVIAFLSLLLIYALSFYYLPSLSTSINKEISTIVPNLILKQKRLSRLIFFCKFRSKKNYLICSHPFFLTFFF